jgi:Ca-activated chloride channel family protein
MSKSKIRTFTILFTFTALAMAFVGCYSAPENRSYLSAVTSASKSGEPQGTAPGESETAPRFPDTSIPSKAYGFTPFHPAVRMSTPVSQATPPYDAQYQQSDSIYSQAEELWIISRPRQVASVNDDQYSGTGSMVTKRNGIEVPLPLKHTDVNAKVDGYIATVDVTQQFHNPYDGKIEAVYVFPLPENSAVNEFVMTIGERHIRGIIRERGEAERIYRDARSQGYVASLMTQERPNIFTQSVANIEPGKQIDVNIKYFNTLAYMDGWFEFVFPMVVGPRFNPVGPSTGVGSVPRGAQGASGQATEVSYLRPGERSGHDIALRVELDAGVAIEEFQCTTHPIVTQRPAADKLIATLANSDRVPNKDFVLRYRVTGEEIKAGLLTHRDERGGFFTMMLYPPTEIARLPRGPLEMVFVLDCSGSMDGRPIAQAKEAIRTGLKMLEPGDTFQLINFSMSASQLGSQPLEATRQNIQFALRHLEQLNAEGGTMMIEGIKAALDFPHDPRRLRCVCFLTDGYIGNEAEILTAVRKKLGSTRIFSFGVGPSINRYLLDSMARLGRGAVAYLLNETESGPVMREFFDRISHAALTDLRIDWAGMNVTDVYPKTIPDLFAGRPVLVTGRFNGEAPVSVRVTARRGEDELNLFAPVLRDETSPALASIWARAKIADLSLTGISGRSPSLERQIKRTALEFSLLSQFTAFIAVDSTHRTEGWQGTTVPVAVPVPEGGKYQTTVRE